MASRGLSAGAITELGASEVEMYHLLRIDFSSPLYYTTAPYDITYDGNLYLSSAVLFSIPDVLESLKIKPGATNIGLSGSVQAIHALLLSESKNIDVYIYRYLISTAETVLMHKGFTDKYSTKEKARGPVSSVNLTVSSHWSNWEAPAGRFLSDAEQQRLYPGDLGLEYVKATENYINYFGAFYQFGELYNTAFNVQFFNFYSTGAINEEIPAFKLPVVYGEASISGKPFFRTLVGVPASINKYLWVGYLLAEGECDSLVDILFDGISYTDPKYSGFISVTFHSGTTTQAADSGLLIAGGSSWTSAHQLKGICYVVITYTYSPDVWTGEPTPVFVLKGKKLYDPRTTLTAWDTNPALVLYDYITNVNYGKGISSADLAEFNAGATYAETLKVDHDAALGGTPANIDLFGFNGLLDLSRSVKDNVEKILFTMRGHLPWISGKYTLVIERDDDTSVYSFDQDNIKGEFEVLERSISGLANIVYYTFLDKEIGYLSSETYAESAAYLAADNNRILRQDFTNKYESNRYRANNRAATILKKSREQIDVKLQSANSDSMQVETGNVIDITRETQGWVSKLFRVTSILLRKDGGNHFELEEYEATNYDWDVSVETDPPANTQLVNPLDVTAPTLLVLESGTNALLLNDDGTIISRIKVTYVASVDTFVTGYNVYIKKPTDTDKLFYARVQDPATTEVYISPVEDGINYTVSIAAFNSLGTESSLLTDSQVVIGKTAVPDDVTGFIVAQNGGVIVMKWDQVADLDLAGYEIRYGRAGATSWEDASPLTSVTRGTNVTSADIPPGNWDVYIKAVDTTGNYSTNETGTSIIVTSFLDVISQVEQSPDWIGTLVNFVRHHTGKLVPQSQDSDSTDGGTILWSEDTVFEIFVTNPYQICTYEAPEIDIGFDDLARVWGSIESSLGPNETGISNPKLSIDYKLFSGSYDGFEDWSIGDVDLRYCKHKLTINTDEGVAYVSGFLPTIDQLEHTLKDTNVALVSGSNTITFDAEFHNAPFVSVTVLGTTAVSAMVDNITATTFDVRLFDSSGAATAGTINWEASGI